MKDKPWEDFCLVLGERGAWGAPLGSWAPVATSTSVRGARCAVSPEAISRGRQTSHQNQSKALNAVTCLNSPDYLNL